MVGVAVILEVTDNAAERVGGARGSDGKDSVCEDGMRSSALGTLRVVSSVGMSVASTGMVA